MNATEQIDSIGLENVAKVLQISLEKLKMKTNNPKLFTLREISTLIEKKIVTDKMVLLMLEKLKREA